MENMKTVTVVCDKGVDCTKINKTIKSLIGLRGIFTVVTNGGAVKESFRKDYSVKVRTVKDARYGNPVTLSEKERANKLVNMATEAVLVFSNDLEKNKVARYTSAAAVKAGKPLYIVTENKILEGKEAELAVTEAKKALWQSFKEAVNTNGLIEAVNGFHFDVDKDIEMALILLGYKMVVPLGGLEEVRSGLVYREEAHACLSVKWLGEKVGWKYSIQRLAGDSYNRIIGYKTDNYGGSLVSGEGGKFRRQRVENYTGDLLIVDCNNQEDRKGAVVSRMAANILGKADYLVVAQFVYRAAVYAVMDGICYPLHAVGGDQSFELTRLLESKELKALQAKYKEGKCPCPLRWYRPMVPTSSQMRRGVLPWFEVESPISNWEKEIVETIDKLSGGGASLLIDGYGNGKEVDLETGVKLANRWSLPLTQSSSLGKPKAIALYVGKWQTGDGYKFADGSAFIARGFIGHALKEHGFDKIWKQYGAEQLRAGFNKALALDVESIDPIIKCHANNLVAQVIFVDKDDEVACAVVAKEVQMGEHKGSMIIFTSKKKVEAKDSTGVELYFDLNAWKAAFNVALLPEAFIMEVPHESQMSVTSSQILGGVVNTTTFQEMSRKIVEDYVNSLFDFSGNNISLGEANNDTFVDGLLPKIDAKKVLSDKNLYKVWKKALKKRFLSACDNFNFTIEGSYCKGIPDLTTFFNLKHGITVLKAGEVFIPGLPEGELILIRHPKMAEGEFAKVYNVSLATLLGRLWTLFDQGELSEEAAAFIEVFYKRLQKGVLVFSSEDKGIFGCLGGADLDGDGFLAITDERIKTMYAELTPHTIDFGDPAVSDKKLTMGARLYVDAYLSNLENPNYQVGQVVTFGYMLRYIANDIKSGKLNEAIMKKLAEKNSFFGEFGGRYSNPIRKAIASGLTVDEEVIVRATEEARICATANIVNFKEICEDFAQGYASIVGRTIDSTKHGDVVTAALLEELGKSFRSGAKICGEFKEDSDKFSISKAGLQRTKMGELVYYTNDPMYQLKVYTGEYFTKKLEEFEKTLSFLAEVKISDPAVAVGQKLGTMLTAAMDAFKDASAEDVVPTEKIKEYVAGYFRNVTATYSFKDRLAVAKQSARFDGEENASRFLQLFGGELVLSFLEGKEDKAITERIYGDGEATVALDEVLEFVDGFCTTKNVYTKSKVTGVYHIAKVNGKPCIKVNIGDIAKKWITDSLDEKKVVLKIIKSSGNITTTSGINTSRLNLTHEAQAMYLDSIVGEDPLKIMFSKDLGATLLKWEKKGYIPVAQLHMERLEISLLNGKTFAPDFTQELKGYTYLFGRVV